jgi:hypothetical protein
MEGSCDEVDDLCERAVLREWASVSSTDPSHPCAGTFHERRAVSEGTGRSKIFKKLPASLSTCSAHPWLAIHGWFLTSRGRAILEVDPQPWHFVSLRLWASPFVRLQRHMLRWNLRIRTAPMPLQRKLEAGCSRLFLVALLDSSPYSRPSRARRPQSLRHRPADEQRLPFVRTREQGPR